MSENTEKMKKFTKYLSDTIKCPFCGTEGGRVLFLFGCPKCEHEFESGNAPVVEEGK